MCEGREEILARIEWMSLTTLVNPILNAIVQSLIDKLAFFGHSPCRWHMQLSNF
jgi:surfactin synthase thioesterase subunit